MLMDMFTIYLHQLAQHFYLFFVQVIQFRTMWMYRLYTQAITFIQWVYLQLFDGWGFVALKYSSVIR